MRRKASLWRFGLATVLTPFVASLAASIAITLYFGATSRHEVRIFDGIAAFFFLGLFLTPVGLAYAILFQIPLAAIALRSGRPNALLYLLISAVLGVMLLVGVPLLWALLSGQELSFVPETRDGRAGLLMMALCGLAGGLSTGLLWQLLVVLPARPHKDSNEGSRERVDG